VLAQPAGQVPLESGRVGADGHLAAAGQTVRQNVVAAHRSVVISTVTFSDRLGYSIHVCLTVLLSSRTATATATLPHCHSVSVTECTCMGGIRSVA
jgi:hypothetical protein